MRPKYNVPPIVTAIAIAAGLLASSLSDDAAQARGSDRACVTSVTETQEPGLT